MPRDAIRLAYRYLGIQEMRHLMAGVALAIDIHTSWEPMPMRYSTET